MLTSLLRQQVPVLDFVKWSVTFVEQGTARTMLPLISPSTNQHCTHQAALFFLAADYTGGIALASLIPHWPVIGVHPVAPTEKSMALWLVKGEIKFFRPSVGCLEVSARVEPELHDRVKKRYSQGKTVLETVKVRFRNGSGRCRRGGHDLLRPAVGQAPDRRHRARQDQHPLPAQARLLGGIDRRRAGAGKAEGLFDDPVRRARWRASTASPWPRDSAKNRRNWAAWSPHARGILTCRSWNSSARGGRDLVLLGAGYDMRPFRLDLPGGTRVYELDFPTVLADRQRRLDEFGVKDPAGVTRVQLPIDLRTTPLANALHGSHRFHFARLHRLGRHEHVFRGGRSPRDVGRHGAAAAQQSQPVVAGPDRSPGRFEPDDFPEVKAFMTGMQMLGEPFVFGVDSVEGIHGKQRIPLLIEVVSSDVFLGDHSDPVYSIYHFCTASADTVAATRQRSAQPTWTAHPAHAIFGSPLAVTRRTASVASCHGAKREDY